MTYVIANRGNRVTLSDFQGQSRIASVFDWFRTVRFKLL